MQLGAASGSQVKVGQPCPFQHPNPTCKPNWAPALGSPLFKRGLKPLPIQTATSYHPMSGLSARGEAKVTLEGTWLPRCV